MGRVLLRVIAIFASFLLAGFLLQDALIFGLMPADPATGRGRGCYTALELALSLKRPTNWARPAEFGLAFLSGVYGLALIVCWPKEK